jgi:hypothetical protein
MNYSRGLFIALAYLTFIDDCKFSERKYTKYFKFICRKKSLRGNFLYANIILK